MSVDTREWSWTSLSTLLGCELHFDLQYNKRVKGRSNQTTYLVGRVVHNVIQGWARAAYSDSMVEEALRSALRTEASLLNRLDRASALGMANRATVAVDVTMRAYRELELPEHGAIIEERFKITSAPIRLQGAPDAYDPVTKSIIDLKTQQTGQAKVEQLHHYAWVEGLLGREVVEGIFIYPLQKRVIKRVPITQEDIDAWADKAQRTTERRDGKTPNPGEACTFCDFKQTVHCPATYIPATVSFGKPVSHAAGVRSPRATTSTRTEGPSGSGGQS